MFQHILVPLDGSPRAEQALPVAAHIAHNTGGTVHLLYAIPPTGGLVPYAVRSSAVDDEVYTVLREEAKTYLDRISHSDILTGIQKHAEVLADKPAQAILTYAQAKKADLIVLCSHGHTGLTHWVLGSVAQKIVRHSSIPVLILREEASDSAIFHPERAHPLRVLIGVDGSPLAEAVLAPAAQLVAVMSPSSTQALLHLIQIIKPTRESVAQKYRESAINIHEHNRQEAERYLQAITDTVTKEFAASLNLQVKYSLKEDRDVAAALISVAEGHDAQMSPFKYDLIALATHGRGGIQHWVLGSVTERILAGTKLPLLIVRPQEMVTGMPTKEGTD